VLVPDTQPPPGHKWQTDVLCFLPGEIDSKAGNQAAPHRV
jgi:hypothetical protein